MQQLTAMDLQEKLRGTYSGSWAEENAALSVSPLQLYPALAKDVTALPHHLLGGMFPQTGKAMALSLSCQFAILAPKQYWGCSVPEDGWELQSLLGRHLYLMHFLPLAHAKGSIAQWIYCESGKLGSAYDHSVSLDSFPLPSVQMNNESGLSFPFCKP